MNVIINDGMHTWDELMSMLENHEVCYYDEYYRFSSSIKNYVPGVSELMLSLDDVKAIKVVLNEYGYYENVCIGYNGKIYHVKL